MGNRGGERKINHQRNRKHRPREGRSVDQCKMKIPSPPQKKTPEKRTQKIVKKILSKKTEENMKHNLEAI